MGRVEMLLGLSFEICMIVPVCIYTPCMCSALSYLPSNSWEYYAAVINFYLMILNAFVESCPIISKGIKIKREGVMGTNYIYLGAFRSKSGSHQKQ